MWCLCFGLDCKYYLTDLKVFFLFKFFFQNDGQLIASASYDGHARIWSPSGELKKVCAGHNGPVFALKWNKKGSRLVTSGQFLK